MQTKDFLDKIPGVRGYREQIVRAEYLPAQDAEYGELSEGLARLGHEANCI